MITRPLWSCLLFLLCGIFVPDACADYLAGTPRMPGKVTVDPESGDRKVDVTAPRSSMPNQQQAPVHIYPQLGGYGTGSSSFGAPPFAGGQSAGTRPPYGGRPPYASPPYGARPPYGDKPSYDGKPPYIGKPPYDTRPPYGGRPPYASPPYGERPPYGDRPPYIGKPPYGAIPPYGGRPGVAPSRPDASRPLPFPTSAR